MTTREAFEDWYEVDCYPREHSNWFRLDSDGDYEFDEVQYAWRTWQAAKATCPAWHDAPTEPGLWVCLRDSRHKSYRVRDIEVQVTIPEDGDRWYGPIPPDGDKP